jgi:hypothetical protein
MPYQTFGPRRRMQAVTLLALCEYSGQSNFGYFADQNIPVGVDAAFGVGIEHSLFFP